MTSSKIDAIETIESVLPQTQCDLCGYGGCTPYATALITENAPIHLCLPGGVTTLNTIASILEKDPTPYLSEMEQKSIPKQLAIIQEANCIGCTKCISACPVDAIVGSRKKMHTVIADECTGCAKCVPVCPVDCIRLETIPTPTEEIIKQKAALARKRFQARTQRLKIQTTQTTCPAAERTQQEKQDYIRAAIIRSANKRKLLTHQC